jgi:hypothetical protein
MLVQIGIVTDSVYDVLMKQEEMYTHLNEQLGFLRVSCREFDSGNKAEAKRIALTTRILVHDTEHSKSLLKMLGVKKGFRFYDTTFEELPNNVMPYLGLVGVKSGGGDTEYWAPLDQGEPSRYQKDRVLSPKWWLMPIVNNKRGLIVTRKKLILAMCNKAGGAHIDDAPGDYERLRDDPGYYLTVGKEIIKGWELESTRQIGYELERSLLEGFPDQLPK